MTITKGVSHKQGFLKSTLFSHQHKPKPEFHTKRHKKSSHDFFSENKVSPVTFGYFNAMLNFLDGGFCSNQRNLIFKVSKHVNLLPKTFKIKFFQFKIQPPSRKFTIALKYPKVPEETLFSEKSRGPNFYGTGCEIQVMVNIDVKIVSI